MGVGFLLACFNLTCVFFKAVSSRLLLKFIELCLSMCILISLIITYPNHAKSKCQHFTGWSMVSIHHYRSSLSNSKAAPHMSLPMRGSILDLRQKGGKRRVLELDFVETMIASSSFNHQQFGICNHK